MGICYFFLCVEPHTKFLCLQQGRGLILVEGGGGGGAWLPGEAKKIVYIIFEIS